MSATERHRVSLRTRRVDLTGFERDRGCPERPWHYLLCGVDWMRTATQVDSHNRHRFVERGASFPTREHVNQTSIKGKAPKAPSGIVQETLFVENNDYFSILCIDSFVLQESSKVRAGPSEAHRTHALSNLKSSSNSVHDHDHDTTYTYVCPSLILEISWRVRALFANPYIGNGFLPMRQIRLGWEFYRKISSSPMTGKEACDGQILRIRDRS